MWLINAHLCRFIFSVILKQIISRITLFYYFTNENIIMVFSPNTPKLFSFRGLSQSLCFYMHVFTMYQKVGSSLLFKIFLHLRDMQRGSNARAIHVPLLEVHSFKHLPTSYVLFISGKTLYPPNQFSCPFVIQTFVDLLQINLVL